MFVSDKAKFVPAPVKADPYSLEALIAWLRNQPADKEYDFTDPAWQHGIGCLFAQYGAAIGHSADFGGYKKTIVGFNGGNDTCSDPFADAQLAVAPPHTMGGALSRALALQESRS